MHLLLTSVKPVAKEFLTLLCVNLFVFYFFNACSSLALSINAAISFVSIISSFSNSDDCLICGFISSGFCFFLLILFFLFYRQAMEFCQAFLCFCGRWCLFGHNSFFIFFNFINYLLAFGAKGMLCLYL